MAVNVDTVYRTVLLILNKEQRGYMTPDEFNKTANQVQLEIYLKYFEDLNQLLRVPQVDLDYASRIALLDEKLSIFKSSSTVGNITTNGFQLPIGLQELGNVIYNNIEIERVQRSEYYNLLKSDLTIPSETYPIYLYENGYIKIQPLTITSGVSVNYLRTPVVASWDYTVGPRGNYIYNSDSSLNFELHASEQTEIVLRILEYSGIIIRDTEIIQVANEKVRQSHINEKQ